MNRLSVIARRPDRGLQLEHTNSGERGLMLSNPRQARERIMRFKWLAHMFSII